MRRALVAARKARGDLAPWGARYGLKSTSVRVFVPVSWISTSGAASASVLARTMVMAPLVKM